MTPDRSGFDEAVANLFSNPKYAPNYLFYGHMVGQCRVVFDTTMKAPAGVNFMHDHFNLYINPNDTWVEADPAKLASAKHKPQTRQTADGKTEICLKGFNSYTLEQRLGILKHEMLHILYNHMRRKGDRDHQGFNIASDCAINQLIERGTPTTVTESLKTKVKELLADESKQKAVATMQFKNLQELYDYLIKL